MDEATKVLYDLIKPAATSKMSYTKISTYLTCPRKYEYVYLTKDREPPNEAMLVGKAVHSALETWVAEDGKDVDDLLDIFTASCAYQRNYGPLSEYEEEEARAMLQDYYNQLSSVDKDKIVGVEEEFELELPTTKLVGVIDRATYLDDNHQVLLITDYKSGRSSISQAKAKSNLQMGIYTMAAKEKWPAQHYITELSYPRLGKAIRHEFTEEELEGFREIIRDVSVSIRLDSRFAPKGTPPVCGYCGFSDDCGWGKLQAKIWKGIQKKREANAKL